MNHKYKLFGSIISVILIIFLLVYLSVNHFAMRKELAAYQEEKNIVGTYMLCEGIVSQYYLVLMKEDGVIKASFYEQLGEIKEYTLVETDEKDTYCLKDVENVYLVFYPKQVHVLHDNRVDQLDKIKDTPNFVNVKQ